MLLVSTPGGMEIEIFCAFGTLPVPVQCVHAFSGLLPLPLQYGHSTACENTTFHNGVV